MKVDMSRHHNVYMTVVNALGATVCAFCGGPAFMVFDRSRYALGFRERARAEETTKVVP